MICQSSNPDCFRTPIKLLRTHPVDAEIMNGSYRYLTNFSLSASDHKPLHVLRI